MNSCLKYFSASLLALLTQAAFAQNAPTLGSASSFAVLGSPPLATPLNPAVTCTDSTITGDVGSTGVLATVVQTRCTISGAVIAPVSAGVLADFNGAYDALKLEQCDQVLTTLDVAQTLSPGVYCFDAAATAVGKVLTLDGGSNATWLFKIGTLAPGALTGTNFKVVMAGGASACNVTWWVDAAATMTDSDFKGTILAGAGITVTGTAGTLPSSLPFEGRALAKAAVTLTDVAFVGCEGGSLGGRAKSKCNQGVGNGPENCDPGNSNQDGHGSNPFDGARNTNDELGGTPGNPGRKGGNIK